MSWLVAARGMNAAATMARIESNNFLFNLGLSSVHSFVYCGLWGPEPFEPPPQPRAATLIDYPLLEYPLRPGSMKSGADLCGPIPVSGFAPEPLQRAAPACRNSLSL